MFVCVCVCVCVCTWHSMWMSHCRQRCLLKSMNEEFGLADLIFEVVQEDKKKVIITCACGACDDHVMTM